MNVRGTSSSAHRRADTSAGRAQALGEAAAAAVVRAGQTLLARQNPDGFWCGELLADTTLESDYVLLQLWLHPPRDGVWDPPTRGLITKAQRAILDRQMAGGGFNVYPGGPADVNATIKAYTALKLSGLDPRSDPMRRARSRILELGGLQEANSYVRINLSLFGLYARKFVPTIPPELVLVPGGLIYEMSSWTRAILVALSIVQARGGVRPVPAGFDLQELVAPGRRFNLPKRDRLSTLFHHLDGALRIWANRGPARIRTAAIRAAEKWVIDRTRYSAGLAGIFPAMMYAIMALDSLGYARDHPDLVEAIRQLDALLTETDERINFQPCFSPVWDTAIAMFALGEAGVPAGDALRRAADWLIGREVRRRGDWSVKRPDLEPSGWAFEFTNEHYPDIDDTAMVLLALEHARASDADAQARCERRAVHWLANMQSRDGGWAAFDVDNNWAILNAVPFADHNAMLDPTCPDITGRVVDALCRRGWDPSDARIRSAAAYLLKAQEAEGSWYGRWGVAYVYGTFLALRGLRAAREPNAGDAIARASDWLVSVQNADGGWGESCGSYVEEKFVRESSTPSQTAWALLGLQAAECTDDESFLRGVRHLVDTQNADGAWDEDLATGTGFPNVFYMRYTMYRHYFPLLALAHAARALGAPRRSRGVPRIPVTPTGS